MRKDIHFLFIKLRIGRFLFLLISIVLMFTVRPFLEGFVGINILMDIFVILILVSGVYAASNNKYIYYIALTIALLALIANWLNSFVSSPFFFLASKTLGGGFYVLMIIIILTYLFKEKQITGDVIAGAICAYFLIGLMWSVVFSVLELQCPGSFEIPENLLPESDSFTYYSYVTLTTLGYGDITPVSAQAKSLSILEAITGQFYLATLVARLVSLNIMQSMKKE